MATTSCHVRWAGIAQASLISFVLFSLYVNNMPTHLHRVALALYEVYTAIIVISHKLTLLVSYLES
jgi:hypothetical protein